MLKITRINVNDRISNRADNVLSILESDLLGGLLHSVRCLMHQVCFALTYGIGHPVSGGMGFKRYAYHPVSASPTAPPRWQRTATATARGVRSAG